MSVCVYSTPVDKEIAFYVTIEGWDVAVNSFTLFEGPSHVTHIATMLFALEYKVASGSSLASPTAYA